VLATTLRYRNW